MSSAEQIQWMTVKLPCSHDMVLESEILAAVDRDSPMKLSFILCLL